MGIAGTSTVTIGRVLLKLPLGWLVLLQVHLQLQLVLLQVLLLLPFLHAFAGTSTVTIGTSACTFTVTIVTYICGYFFCYNLCYCGYRWHWWNIGQNQLHCYASRHQLLTCITTYNWMRTKMMMRCKDDDRDAPCHRQVCDTYHKL